MLILTLHLLVIILRIRRASIHEYLVAKGAAEWSFIITSRLITVVIVLYFDVSFLFYLWVSCCNGSSWMVVHRGMNLDSCGWYVTHLEGLYLWISCRNGSSWIVVCHYARVVTTWCSLCCTFRGPLFVNLLSQWEQLMVVCLDMMLHSGVIMLHS